MLSSLFAGFASHSGTFSNIVFADPGYSGSFDYATGALTIIPEPATIALLALAAACLCRKRRAGR